MVPTAARLALVLAGLAAALLAVAVLALLLGSAHVSTTAVLRALTGTGRVGIDRERGGARV